jgi:hypothetical protein
MNKLVTAAIVGGAAIAVGVLPAASLALAATAPTPIPVPTSPTAPTTPGVPGTTGTPSAPTAGSPTPGKPTHHKTHRGHKKGSGTGTGTGTGTRKPGAHKRPSHHPVKHKPAHKPVVHKPVHSPVTQPPTTQPPAANPPVVHPPITRRPIARRPIAKKPVMTPSTQSAPAPRIVGGKNAGDAPWAVQVSWDDTGFECSGTAVAPQWVLTAGHCANSDGMTVLIGSNQLGQGTEDTVDNQVVDPDGDLALLHLTDPVQTTYVALADADPEVGSINSIFGWGKTDPDSGPSAQLKTAKVKVTSVDCQDGAQGKAICSTGINGTAYNGDSGGPEMADGVEVGVCSTGDVDTKTQEYASVAANRDWIRQVASV